MRGLLSLTVLAVATVAGAAEPPTRLILEIDGTSVEVEAGQRFDLLIDDKKRSARISELPTRRFDAAGIRFEYSRHFSWEHDSPDIWTLDGNNAVLILTRGQSGDDSTAEDVLDGMTKSRGKHSSTYRKIALDTRQGHIEGLEGTVEMSGIDIRNEAYVLERGDVFALLILQDSSDGNAADAAEFQSLRKLLATTLEF